MVMILSESGMAQTLVSEMSGANTRFIPGCYMKDGVAAIYFSEDEYGYTPGSNKYVAEIYGFDLQPIKRFSFDTLIPYVMVSERAASGTVERVKVMFSDTYYTGPFPEVSDMDARKEAYVTQVYNDYRDYYTSMSLDELRSACRVSGDTVFVKLPSIGGVGGGTDAYLKNTESYLTPADRRGIARTYSTIVPRYDGDMKETRADGSPVSHFMTPRCYDVDRLNHWNGGLWLPFSQTYFNTDDRFEYVRYKAYIGEEGEGSSFQNNPYFDSALTTLFGITPSDRDGDGVKDYEVTHTYGVIYTGLEVVDEDGNLLFDFPLADKCLGKPSAYFYKSSNFILAEISFVVDDNTEFGSGVTRFYRLDNSASSPTLIREERRMITSPNPSIGGTPVEVKLPVSKGGVRKVMLSSLSGHQINMFPVAHDQDKVMIETSGMSAGIYLLTLTENGKIIETSKMMVR